MSLVCYSLLVEAVHTPSLGDGEKQAESIAKDGDRGGECRNHVNSPSQGAEEVSSFAAHLLLVKPHVFFVLMVSFPADSLAFVFQLRK